MNKLFLRHLILTAALLVATVTIFSLTPLDMLVQNTLYNGSTHQWWWDKQEPWARLLFYDGIKAALFVFFMLLLSTLLLSRFKPSLKPLRAGLVIVMLSMILVPSAVSMLKAATNMACPVNLVQYGGKVEHVSLFASYPADKQPSRAQKCFPAGHASGGFALLSLIFLMPSARSRQLALVGTLSLGWLMGGYKMVIGDHFLSHTLISMLLAWMIICTLAWQVYRHYDAPRDLQEFFARPRLPGDIALTPVPQLVASSIDLPPEKVEQ